jgi:hypothetical protein
VELPSFVLFIRYIRVRWAGHKADKLKDNDCLGDVSLGRRMLMSLSGTGRKDVDWIYMTQDVVDW